MGRRQVARHQPLELAYPGSNPGAPANAVQKVCYEIKQGYFAGS